MNGRDDQTTNVSLVADCLSGYAQGHVTTHEALDTLGMRDPSELRAALRDAGLTRGAQDGE